jgi:hypothetical protein
MGKEEWVNNNSAVNNSSVSMLAALLIFTPGGSGEAGSPATVNVNPPPDLGVGVNGPEIPQFPWSVPINGKCVNSTPGSTENGMPDANGNCAAG